MATKITSRAVINAGSLGRLPIKEGAEIEMGNLKREAQMGDDGVLGYAESWDVPPSIKCTIIHAKDTDEKVIAEFVDETITVELDSGKVYTLKEAWTVDPLSLNTKEGQMEVLFNGVEMIQQ